MWAAVEDPVADAIQPAAELLSLFGEGEELFLIWRGGEQGLGIVRDLASVVVHLLYHLAKVGFFKALLKLADYSV